MGQLLTKEGVTYFDPIPPAGQAILNALKFVASALDYDLTITSGTDGMHSGPNDPHHIGNAYDVRSHGLPNKGVVLRSVMLQLAASNELPEPKDDGLVTEKFFGWLEAAGADNEHFHFQLRHGVEYP